MKLQEVLKVALRDIVPTIVGLGGIIHQEFGPPSAVKPELLILYAALLGIPGVANVIGLVRSPTATGTSLSESPPSSSSSPSSSPSSSV